MLILFGLEGVSDQMAGTLGGSTEMMMNLRENSKVGERERETRCWFCLRRKQSEDDMNYVCFDLL